MSQIKVRVLRSRFIMITISLYLAFRLISELLVYSIYRDAFVFRMYGQHFQTFPLKPLGRLKPFHVETPWDERMKVCSNGPGHMTKMAAMPIYSKTFKNLLLRNQKANDLETWYAVSNTRVLLILFIL